MLETNKPLKDIIKAAAQKLKTSVQQQQKITKLRGTLENGKTIFKTYDKAN